MLSLNPFLIIIKSQRKFGNLKLCNKRFCLLLGTHNLPYIWKYEGEFSINKGVFLDILDLLSENNPALKVHFNITLGSACKLTYPEIQNKILDSINFRN